MHQSTAQVELPPVIGQLTVSGTNVLLYVEVAFQLGIVLENAVGRHILVKTRFENAQMRAVAPPCTAAGLPVLWRWATPAINCRYVFYLR